MISLLVPWFGGNPEALIRTRDSTIGIADEMVVVHQQLFDDDADVVRSIADKVAVVDWNACAKLGFGELTNQGLPLCSNPWVLWFGTGETVGEQYQSIRETLEKCENPRTCYQCNHHGDHHTWRRIFNHRAGVRVGGLIHEDVTGNHGPVIFRMEDTPKPPHEDPFRNECLKWAKSGLYNGLYRRLGNHHEELSATDAGWLRFIEGAWGSITAYCNDNADIVDALFSGDRQAFYNGVYRRMEADKPAVGVNFNRTGEKTSGNETVNMQCNEN